MGAADDLQEHSSSSSQQERSESSKVHRIMGLRPGPLRRRSSGAPKK